MGYDIVTPFIETIFSFHYNVIVLSINHFHHLKQIRITVENLNTTIDN